jgi:hypothetical protein
LRDACGDVLEVLCSNPQAAKKILQEQSYVLSATIEERWLWLGVDDAGSAMPKIISALERSGLAVHDVRVRELTLEDVFVGLTKSGGS